MVSHSRAQYLPAVRSNRNATARISGGAVRTPKEPSIGPTCSHAGIISGKSANIEAGCTDTKVGGSDMAMQKQ